MWKCPGQVWHRLWQDSTSVASFCITCSALGQGLRNESGEHFEGLRCLWHPLNCPSHDCPVDVAFLGFWGVVSQLSQFVGWRMGVHYLWPEVAPHTQGPPPPPLVGKESAQTRKPDWELWRMIFGTAAGLGPPVHAVPALSLSFQTWEEWTKVSLSYLKLS